MPSSPEKVYREADFITVHLPKNAETLGFVDDEAFAQMKDGVRVVNVARGGIIDEESLARALESGKVAAAGVDVFPVEPTTDDLLLAYDAVVVTPHLGASTAEASVRAGTIIAEQVSAALKGELAGNAVNVPLVPGEEADELMPFLPVCKMLGELVTQLADGPVDDLEIAYEGNVARYDTRILTVAVLEGILKNTVEDEVNFVSAGPMAEERGISYREEKKPVVTDFLNLVRVRAFDAEHELVVAGTTLGPRHRPRFVTVYGLDLDIEPVEHMVFVRAHVARAGHVRHDRHAARRLRVNVSQVSVAMTGEGEPGVMGLALDAPISDDAAGRARRGGRPARRQAGRAVAAGWAGAAACAAAPPPPCPPLARLACPKARLRLVRAATYNRQTMHHGESRETSDVPGIVAGRLLLLPAVVLLPLRGDR